MLLVFVFVFVFVFVYIHTVVVALTPQWRSDTEWGGCPAHWLPPASAVFTIRFPLDPYFLQFFSLPSVRISYSSATSQCLQSDFHLTTFFYSLGFCSYTFWWAFFQTTFATFFLFRYCLFCRCVCLPSDIARPTWPGSSVCFICVFTICCLYLCVYHPIVCICVCLSTNRLLQI